MQNRLFVGNLSFSTDEDTLRTLFAQHGEVAKATLVTERETGRSRGFAFIEYVSAADAARAISATDGSDLDGRALRVSVATPRPERGAERGGGGRDGRNRW